MKKIITALLLTSSLLLLAGCNPDAKFMAAENHPDQIGDPEFGFYFTLPAEWEIVSQDKNTATIKYPTGRELRKSEEELEIEHKNIYLRLYDKDPEQSFSEWLEDNYLCYFCDGKKTKKSENQKSCKILDITDTTRNAYCARDEGITTNFITNRTEPRNKVVAIDIENYSDIRASYESETSFIELMKSMRFE